MSDKGTWAQPGCWSREIDRRYTAHDFAGAVETARQMLKDPPLSRPLLEQAAGLFIDQGCSADAERTIAILQQNFSETGYTLFLRCRAAQLAGRTEEALQLGEAAAARQDLLPWQRSMTENILGHMYRRLGEVEKAAAHYRISAEMRHSAVDGSDSLAIQDYSNYLFTRHHREMDRSEMAKEIAGYDAFFRRTPRFSHDQRRHRHRRLRIGYLSPDLRRHVVAFFSYAFFLRYDKQYFEVYAYAKCAEDEVSHELAANIDAWRNIRFAAPQEAARRIYDDEIDILVDLAGHTADNGLPIIAYKPAPVIVSGIGWFDSTGLSAVDYFLTDRLTAPPEHGDDRFFTECLLRLPESHFCYMWHDAPPPVSPAPFLSSGRITFGSFNNFAKVTDEMLRLWAEILERVPGSRLFLKAAVFGDGYGRRLARKRLERAGIAWSSVHAEPTSPDYLEKYRQIDIALDTYPYPGGGTTCDALYMGVPVVTLAGDCHHARFGLSLLTNLGCPELIAASPEEYVRKAVALAQDRGRLRRYHLKLRRQMRQSPLMQSGRYMAAIEEAYRQIFLHWQRGGRPEDFVLSAPSGDEMLRRGLAYAEEAMSRPPEERDEKDRRLIASRRAAYWLERAGATNGRLDALTALRLAEVRRNFCDHAGAFRAVCMAEKILGDEVQRSRADDALAQELESCKAETALTMGRPAEAYLAWQEAWEAARRGGRQEEAWSLFSSLLLTAHYLPFSSEDIAQLTSLYAPQLSALQPFTAWQPHGGRLRIGFLSPDFRWHVMFPFYYGFFVCLDRKKFEVTAYHLSAVEDAFTAQVRKAADHFVDLHGRSLREAAERIHTDGIDVLVDLAGHSCGSGLPILAFRPAPVQISGLGYLASTGLPQVDGFLTDEVTDPPGTHERFFTEKLCRLPSQFCYAGRSDVPASRGTPARKKGVVTFGVFNHYRKITDEMLELWREILAQVPGSRLLFKSQELVSDSLVDAAYARMHRLGLPMERVIFEPATVSYLERYLAVDIALDTYPYPGGGTTCDALYMGVPVITRYGERRNTRFGLSFLTALGLRELAAPDGAGYVARAVGLAKDIELLDMLHTGLRQRMMHSPLGRMRNYVRAFERQVLSLVQVHAEGQTG